MIPPSHVYYFEHGEGTWRGSFRLRITDRSAFRRARLGWANRLFSWLADRLDRALGPCAIASRIQAHRERGPLGTATNSIRMTRFGIPIYRQEIEYCLEEDGRSVTVRGWERLGPVPGLFRHRIEHWGRVGEDGLSNEYRVPMLGAEWIGSYRLSGAGELRSRLACPWAEGGEELRRAPDPQA